MFGFFMDCPRIQAKLAKSFKLNSCWKEIWE